MHDRTDEVCVAEPRRFFAEHVADDGVHRRFVHDDEVLHAVAELRADCAGVVGEALRRVALGLIKERDLPHRDIERLKRLQLVEGADDRLALTLLGRQRYASLPRPALFAESAGDAAPYLVGASLCVLTLAATYRAAGRMRPDAA